MPEVSPDDSITIHSSWRGIIGSFAGAVLVLVAGIFAVAAAGVRAWPILILVVGTVMMAGVLLDYPIASRFDVRGVERRPVLRRQLLRWDRIDRITRSRPSLRASLRQLNPGGLVAVVGRRKYLLVDRIESPAEYDRLQDVVSAITEHERLDDVVRPSPDVAPTWLYRRRRWRGDVFGGR